MTTTITREELYQRYLIEKESKRKMVIQKHVEKIKEAIFNDNSLGKQIIILVFGMNLPNIYLKLSLN